VLSTSERTSALSKKLPEAEEEPVESSPDAILAVRQLVEPFDEARFRIADGLESFASLFHEPRRLPIRVLERLSTEVMEDLAGTLRRRTEFREPLSGLDI
jgi:hypothetical protein